MILTFSHGWPVVLGIGTTLAYAIPALAGQRLGASTSWQMLVLAWLLHALTISTGFLGPEPHFGFAPALSGTAWLALTVYGVERQVFPQMQPGWALAGLGAASVVLAMVFPGAVQHPSASAWLPLHFLLGIASYGLFAAAIFHAWLMTRAEKSMRQASHVSSGLPLLTLERLTFRFVTAGFVLLSLTLLAGMVFTESLYGAGKVWRWDHKTIFSVLSWITFAVLLAGRRLFGWRGRTAIRMLYGGSALLLLGYVGSRFVIEVILGRNA